MSTNNTNTVLSFALACGLLLSCDPSDPKSEFSVLAHEIPGGTLLSVTTMGDESVFVGGQLDGGTSVIVRYDGTSLCYEENVTDRALWWIHSAREGEFYAVGEAGTILHSVDGQRIDESVETEATFFGVWDAGDRVIAVGGVVRGDIHGEIWIREDGTWSLFDGELPGVAFKVWNNWVVGNGIAYHLGNGATPVLEERNTPNNDRLTTIIGRSDDDVVAVGGFNNPIMLTWTNGAWEELEVDFRCANMGLNGVWTAPGENIWIAGFSGSMGEMNQDETWNCAASPPTYEDFHVVARHGDEMLFAGGNLNEQGGNYGTIARYSTSGAQLTATPCE